MASGRAAGELASWRAGELASWRAGELASWRAGELASWRAGELASWRAGELASAKHKSVKHHKPYTLPATMATMAIILNANDSH